MKPLPNFDDVDAMADRGRRSLLGALRNEATAELRDAHTAIQSASWGRLHAEVIRAQLAVVRLGELAALWNQYEDGVVDDV